MTATVVISGEDSGSELRRRYEVVVLEEQVDLDWPATDNNLPADPGDLSSAVGVTSVQVVYTDVDTGARLVRVTAEPVAMENLLRAYSTGDRLV